MTIPSISSPPAWPSITDPTNFDQEAEDFVQWWEDNFAPELEAVIDAMNELGATLTSYAAGGAFSFPYTVSSTTTDSDPGAGFMRFDNFAAQTSAATLRLDLLSADTVDRTNELTYATASTSTTKGRLKIIKTADPTKWLTADYTAMATPTGYRNITITNVVGSSAAPFANLESVLIFFQPNGLKGDTGIAAITYDERSANVILANADSGTHIRYTSGTFSQTVNAVATLSAGWYVIADNAGTGTITFDPNGAELINGASTLAINSGEVYKISRDEAGTGFTATLLNRTHIALATQVATTSGTTADFTGIPSYAKRVTVMLNGFSTNGPSIPIIQIGDSGGIETTGYTGATTRGSTSAAWGGTGVAITDSNAAGSTYTGCVVFELMDAATNTWLVNGTYARDNAAMITAGLKALSATLDRVRLTTTNGTDVFDAGSVNVSWE